MIDYENRPPKYRGTIEVIEGADGDWYWRGKARNGLKIEDGAEGYSRRDKCIRAADRANAVEVFHGFIEPRECVVPWRLVIHDRTGRVEKIGALY